MTPLDLAYQDMLSRLSHYTEIKLPQQEKSA